jgi:sugar lactone lactonase YvrE
MLAASGDATPDVKLGGFGAPTGIAFDTGGNLFVGDHDNNRVYRFDATQLGASTSTPALTLLARTADTGGADIRPDLLAFDTSGALWVSDFGANTLSKLAPAAIAGTGTPTATASVVITVGVSALIDSIAFDESGGLWTTYSQGKIARLAPSQLGTSTDAGSPTIPMTILASPDVGYAGAIAFFAPPSNIPIFAQP